MMIAMNAKNLIFERVRGPAGRAKEAGMGWASIVFVPEIPAKKVLEFPTMPSGKRHLTSDAEVSVYCDEGSCTGMKLPLPPIVIVPDAVARPKPAASTPLPVQAGRVWKQGDTYANTLAMKFTYLPPGEFDMGSAAGPAGGRKKSDQTLHHVKLSKPLFMATTLVTVDQFKAFADADHYRSDAEKIGWSWELFNATGGRKYGGSWKMPGFPQAGDHPVVAASWNDAVAFCAWLSKKENLKYRLPTEAEWEYACRAGSQKAYPWGDDPSDGKGWANCADQTLLRGIPKWKGGTFNWSDEFVNTSPVGSFKANGWGLYDMIGNAWEWCSDQYGDYPSGAVTDPEGPPGNTRRVLRGGSWTASPDAGCALRWSCEPTHRCNDIGFRVVLDVE